MASSDSKNEPERPNEEQVALAAVVGAAVGVIGWVGDKLIKGQGKWR
jgi:hypothetical protein